MVELDKRRSERDDTSVPRGYFMKSIRDEARKILDSQPDDVTWDRLAYLFDARASIERGLTDEKAGRVYTQAQAEAEVEKWLASRGRKKRLVG
jgi:hypothetical protein